MGLSRLSRRVTGWLLPVRDREFVLGDLSELRHKWAREAGSLVATYRYLGALLGSITARRSGSTSPSGGGGGHRRDHRFSGLWRSFSADARHAARSCLRQPGFVFVAAVTLGLGVGSAGVVFSMANQLLLRPPPGVADHRGTAVLELRTGERDYVGISSPDMVALRNAATLLDGFASTDTLRSAAHVSAGESRPVALNAFTVYGDYFELLGVRPAVGRLLTAEDTGPGAEPLVAVISERLWERLFGRAPDVVGRQIRMSGQRLTVRGVAAGGFRGTDRGWPVDVWVPKPGKVLDGDPPDRIWSRESTLNQDFVVRLRPGVSADAAQGQLDSILAGLAATDPEHREFLSELRATLLPGLQRRLAKERLLAILGAFSGAAALVVLIACANVANLLLVRGLQGRSELAVRRALGASAARVVRQQMIESAYLAAVGTLVGFVVAWTIGWIFTGDPVLGFQGFSLDIRVLGFAAAAIAATTLLFGGLPAALVARFDLEATLRGAGRKATRRGGFSRWAMSALQIALSLSLLIGGVLLARTVHNLYAMDPGIAVEEVSVVVIEWGADRPDAEARRLLYRQLPAAVREVPGVEAAAMEVWYGPYVGRPNIRIGLLDTPDEDIGSADVRRVTSEWFEVLGIEPLIGRTLRPTDARASSLPVAVLSAPLAQRLFGRVDVVGQSVRVGRRDLEGAEIVGVVGDVRLADVRSEPDEAVFLPLVSESTGPPALLARTATPGAGAADSIRRAVEAVLPDIAVPQPITLSDRIDEQLAEQRVFMRLLGLLSALGVVLAAVGLYGVVAFAVAGRKREFGIRMALGAEGHDVIRLVARYALEIVVAGIVLGLAGAWALSGVIESRLFGVAAVDVGSYALAAGLVAMVAAVACCAPALAAARVDPAGTLRRD